MTGALLSTAARLALAAVWLYAGVTKLGDPDTAVRAVRAYQAVPEALVEPVAWGLPFVELALAVLLVTGLASRAAALASLVVLAVFVVGMVSVWARGLSIDCGCFGSGGPADVDGGDYALDIARDLAFAGLALAVLLGPAAVGELRVRLPAWWRSNGGQAALLAVAVAGSAVVGIVVQERRSELAESDVVSPAGDRGADADVAGTPWVAGRPDAPVVVQVYEDFTCHDCRQFHDEAEPALAPLLAEGVARVAYHPMPTRGEPAIEAVAAAACAFDAGAFPRYRDALYTVQAGGGAGLDRDALAALGSGVGITDPAFAECVAGGTYEGWARERLDAGSRRGVVVTPTVFVDGEALPRPLTASSLAAAVRRAEGSDR